MTEDKQWVRVWAGNGVYAEPKWYTLWPLRLDEPMPPNLQTFSSDGDPHEPTYTKGDIRLTFAFDGTYLDRFETPTKPCVCGAKDTPFIRRYYLSGAFEAHCAVCNRRVTSAKGRDHVIRLWNQDTVWDRAVRWLRKWNNTVGFWAWVGVCWYAMVLSFGMATPEWPQFPLYVSTACAPVFLASWGASGYLKRTQRGLL